MKFRTATAGLLLCLGAHPLFAGEPSGTLDTTATGSRPATESTENLRVFSAPDEAREATSMMRRYLTAGADAAFERWNVAYEALETPIQIAEYQAERKSKFHNAIGGLPNPTPLNSRVTGVMECDGFRIEKVLFESQPKHFVSATLYIPTREKYRAPYPGVLVACGHSDKGKGYEMYARAAALCALNGLAALVPDPIEQGERIQWHDEAGEPAIRGGTYGHTVIGISAALLGQNTARFEIWDVMRGIDYLQSRPEVDGELIGVTGNSGGGTQTSHIMALDERVDVAVPSCYLTSFQKLLGTIGPQDAEQNIYGQLGWGMDHADYVLMRAPKPTLISANTQDFFDIGGTWDTFRRAKRLYTRMGMADHVDIQEIDEEHGFHELSREGAVRFLAKHLRGDAVRAEEPNNLELPLDEALWTTENGRVMDLPGARSVYDLLEDDLAALTAMRPTLSAELVRDTIGLAPFDQLPAPSMDATGRVERPGYGITKMVLRFNEPLDAENSFEIALPGLLFQPNVDTPQQEAENTSRKKRRGVLYIHAHGKSADAGANGPIETLVADGNIVLAVDVRGVGETMDPDRKFYHEDFGASGQDYVTAYLLGKSYVGMRAMDILIAAKWLRDSNVTLDDQVDLIAIGDTGVPSLHAAYCQPDLFHAIHERKGLATWASLIHARAHKQQLVNLVHAALTVYDLPDLRAALGDRITIAEPVDPLGQLLPK